MRFFSKSLINNLRIVSGSFSTDFSLVFSPVSARQVFRFSSFYRFTAISLPVKALKSPVNRNWNSVYEFSLFDQCRYCPICRFRLSFPHSWVYRYLHSSRFWQCLCLCRHFLLQDYPEIGFVCCFLRFRWCDWFPILTCSPAISPFSCQLNVFLLLRRFRFFLLCFGFKFLAFRLADYVSFIHL
jgi:hypothetical protein